MRLVSMDFPEDLEKAMGCLGLELSCQTPLLKNMKHFVLCLSFWSDSAKEHECVGRNDNRNHEGWKQDERESIELVHGPRDGDLRPSGRYRDSKDIDQTEEVPENQPGAKAGEADCDACENGDNDVTCASPNGEAVRQLMLGIEVKEIDADEAYKVKGDQVANIESKRPIAEGARDNEETCEYGECGEDCFGIPGHRFSLQFLNVPGFVSPFTRL